MSHTCIISLTRNSYQRKSLWYPFLSRYLFFAVSKSLNYTQKEFAEYLGIPQLSLSAYENDKNSPTVKVLINIATKCNISLDWLCTLNNNYSKEFEISEFKDLVSVIYKLMEINEIGIDIKVNDKLPNDIES